MIARAAGILALIAAGSVISCVQIDRASRDQHSLSLLVPSIFSAESSRIRGSAATQAGLGSRAMSEAKAQIKLRPMPAESLSLLVLAASAQGDEDTALAALNAATQRGWREPLSQFASGQSALSKGQYDIAAQRIVALLSTARLPDETMTLLAELLQQPDGREAFAKRLAAHGLWQDAVLVNAVDNVRPDDWLATLNAASGNGFSPTCDRLATVQESYQKNGVELKLENTNGHCALRR